MWVEKHNENSGSQGNEQLTVLSLNVPEYHSYRFQKQISFGGWVLSFFLILLGLDTAKVIRRVSAYPHNGGNAVFPDGWWGPADFCPDIPHPCILPTITKQRQALLPSSS